jgi:acetyl esterase/lipase
VTRFYNPDSIAVHISDMRSIPAKLCHVRAIVAVLVCACLAACADEMLLAPLNWAGPGTQITAATDLAYGADARQRLDVYRPTGARNAPVMLFWYGGSWQHGAKDYYGFVGATLARKGFIAILPDYRLAPDHPFPVFVEDAAAAVRWARDHATEYGGDSSRIYISGHSAGGHSALMLALDPQYLRAFGMAPRDLAGVISLAGPTGLERLRGNGLKGVFPLDVPDAAFSPIALAPRNAGAAAPFLLIAGFDDDVVHASRVARLADAIRSGGGKVTVMTYPDTGHLGLLLDFSSLFDLNSRVATDMARFAGLQHRQRP